MKSILPKPTDMAHQLLGGVIDAGDLVVDATVGNGADTLFLAEKVGIQGQVIGFDIQQNAIDMTLYQLRDSQTPLELHCVSHAKMSEMIDRKVKAVMFNLGFLPSGDREIFTQSEDTLIALNAACDLLETGGLVTVICYPGHEGGVQETADVIEWASHLPAEWQVMRYEQIGTESRSPILLAIHKRR
jgi:tRNA A58 N-methylase Trm61